MFKKRQSRVSPAPSPPIDQSQSFYQQQQYQQQQQQQPPLPRSTSGAYGLSVTPPPGVPNIAPPASRQTIWNANFAAGHGMPDPRSHNKFVDLEEPQARLTQAFAPHGLLQAGMQDKEDRSAKKQEELAREMGSSLVHVPSKPPPPSAGLLGAVAQHERARKNAGGIGATLTDRERERRLAEERQREFERLQRQQAEQMQQFGGFGQGPQGGYGGYGMMPQMGMPMGMPMGFNPYQGGGYNPYAQQQAMYAAQMAYQNAMMMSAANSQVGGGGDDRSSFNGDGGGAGAGEGSQFGHGSVNGYYGHPGQGQQGQGYPQIPYGWGGMSPAMGPWMSPQPTGSPMPNQMGMAQIPSMQFQGQGQAQGQGDYLQPGGYGQGNGGAGTPGERSRTESLRGSERGRSESRARESERDGDRNRDRSEDRGPGGPVT